MFTALHLWSRGCFGRVGLGRFVEDVMAESLLCFALRRIGWLFQLFIERQICCCSREDEGHTSHISEIKPERGRERERERQRERERERAERGRESAGVFLLTLQMNRAWAQRKLRGKRKRKKPWREERVYQFQTEQVCGIHSLQKRPQNKEFFTCVFPFFRILHPFLSKCMLRMRKRRRLNLIRFFSDRRKFCFSEEVLSCFQNNYLNIAKSWEVSRLLTLADALVNSEQFMFFSQHLLT